MLKTAVSKKLKAITSRHRESWRRWAHDMAAGKPEPTAGDVIEAAMHLGIDDPAERLERDADVVREAARCEAVALKCATRRAEKLAPYGGDIEVLRAAVKVAKAEATRLETLLRDVESVSGYAFRARNHELRKNYPDLLREARG